MARRKASADPFSSWRQTMGPQQPSQPQEAFASRPPLARLPHLAHRSCSVFNHYASLLNQVGYAAPRIRKSTHVSIAQPHAYRSMRSNHGAGPDMRDLVCARGWGLMARGLGRFRQDAKRHWASASLNTGYSRRLRVWFLSQGAQCSIRRCSSQLCAR